MSKLPDPKTEPLSRHLPMSTSSPRKAERVKYKGKLSRAAESATSEGVCTQGQSSSRLYLPVET